MLTLNWYIFSIALTFGSLMLLNVILFIASNLSKIYTSALDDVDEVDDNDRSTRMTMEGKDIDSLPFNASYKFNSEVADDLSLSEMGL